MIEEILSVVRHDVRNSLSSIRLASFYLARKMRSTSAWEEDARVPRFFEQIVEEVERANEVLTHRASALAPIDRPSSRLARTDCIADVVRAFGATLCADAEPTLVAADPDELRVALRCLVRNAMERPTTSAPPEVRVARDGPWIRIEVVDDGPPLSTADLRAARTAFHTRKPGHVGIGLNVVERFARRHDGELELVSDDGGTIARLLLPAAELTDESSALSRRT